MGLRLSSSDGSVCWTLEPGITELGRDPTCRLRIDDSSVSWRHAELKMANGIASVRDLESTNGTLVNDARIDSGEWIELAVDDRLRFGGVTFCLVQERSTYGGGPNTQIVRLRGSRVVIGRDPACDWPVDSPLASWHHCEIRRDSSGSELYDLGSTNGTFLNGQRIRRQALRAGDTISIAGKRYRFSIDSLLPDQIEEGGRLDVVKLGKHLPRLHQSLVDEVSFTLEPNSLAAVVGASGAGKSSLLHAITGYRKAEEGWVLLDGVNYYDHLDELKTKIGFVPQDDILCPDLTVERVLWHAARLRLPQDTTKGEIQHRVSKVLSDLGLTQRAGSVVKTLSGGERKRVNVGVELLGDPRFLLLDEPTTGLDPGTERQLMELFRELCLKGRTVVLVTHATENISLCDRVLFLAQGGVPVFFGPPSEATSFFGVNDFAEIYTRVQSARSPKDLRQDFESSDLHRNFVLRPLGSLDSEHPSKSEPTRLAKAVLDTAHQMHVLTRRYLEEVIADRKNLMLMLLQAPIIAVLMVVLFGTDTLSRDPSIQQPDSAGNVPLQSAPTFLFLLILTCLWCGTNNAAREIVKEAKLFKRERMSGLRIFPYLASKVIVLGSICGIQASLLWLVLEAGVGFHGLSASGHFGLLLWLIGSAVTAMGLGLLISAAAKSVDQAGSILPILLVPQVLFGGLMIPLERMPDLGQALASLSPSRWSFSGVAAMLELPQRFREVKGVNLESQILEVFETPIGSSAAGLGLLAIIYIVATWAVIRYTEGSRA